MIRVSGNVHDLEELLQRHCRFCVLSPWGPTEKLTSVYPCVLFGEICIKEFTAEDTKVHRGILGMEVFEGLPSSRGQESVP